MQIVLKDHYKCTCASCKERNCGGRGRRQTQQINVRENQGGNQEWTI